MNFEEIRLLRVSSTFDATNYTAGAAQKVAADKSMVASSQQAAAAINQVGNAVVQTDTKISQAGDVLSRLSRQYVDGYANAQRFNSALNQLSTGIERGKITMQQAETILAGISQKYGLMGDAAQFAARGQTQFAAAITNANAKLAQQRAIAPANQNQGGLARFGSLNATSQFQDIAITSAMGQSPLTIALQQGTQLGMALEQQLGDKGVKGLVTGLGTAFMGLLTPVNLVAIGLTAAAAVAIQFGSKILGGFKSAEEKARDFNKLLTEQREIIQSLGPAYEQVARQRDGLSPNQFESIGVGRLVLQQNLEDARKAQQEQARAALKEMRGSGGTFLSLIGSLPEGVQSALGRNDASLEFDRIVDSASKSEMSINEARTALQRFGETHPSFVNIIGSFLQISEEAAKTERQVGGLVGVLDRLAKIRLPERGILPKGAAGDQLRAEELAAQNRMQREFDAERLGIGARSPQELAAAARAAAAASGPEGSPGANATRIELAGKKALLEAEQALTDAQDERRRSLDKTLESARLDISLIGKTTSEIEGLRLAAELEAEVRETAAQNHVAADEAEIARIREKATEYGKLRAIEQARDIIHDQQLDIEQARGELGAIGQNTLARNASIASLKAEQEIRKLGIPLYGEEANAIRANTAELSALAEAQAKATLQADLAFERRQIGRDDQDQAIASRLMSAGLPDDLNSIEANMIRANMRLSEAKDDFKGFFHDVLDGFRQGKDAVEAFTNALSNLAGKIADRFLDRAMDELFGMLTGTGGQSSTGGGGGGLLGKLFGALGGGGSSSAFPSAPPVNDNIFKAAGGVFTTAGSQGILDQLGSGGFKTSSLVTGGAPFDEMLAYAKQSAILRGIDPDIGLKVLRSEGLNPGIWQSLVKTAGGGRETSYGPGQLLKGGGLGDTFERETGLSVADPANWRQNIDFSFNKAAQMGWSPWHGAAAVGVGSREGLAGARAVPIGRVAGSGGSDVLGGGAGTDDLIGSRIDRAFGPTQDTIQKRLDNAFEPTQDTIKDRIDTAFGKSGEDIQKRISGAFGDEKGGLKGIGSADEALAHLTDTSQMAADSLSKAGLAGFDTVKGLTDAAGGLTNFGSALSSFMAPGGGSGAGWFQNLIGGAGQLFGGGASGALSFMQSVSPAATASIIGAGGGFTGLFHEGGIAGSATQHRYVDMGAFRGAQRLHSGGFAGDEVPAILRRGEPVFKSMEQARQMFAPANQNIDLDALASKMQAKLKIINLYDPSVVGDYTRTAPGEKAVFNAMRRSGSGKNRIV